MTIFTTENTAYIFSFLDECKGVKQLPNRHPEGDVLRHSIQVFNLACKESNNLDLILAALLHDIGKIVNSHDHEKIALGWLKPYSSVKTLFLIEQHMRIRTLLRGEMKKLLKIEFLVNHGWLPELILLARWDKMGRDPNKKFVYDKNSIIEELNNKVILKWGEDK